MPNTFITRVPDMEDEVREMASAKLAAINDFYEARAKISRLNRDLFDKGIFVGQDLLAW